MIRHHPRCTRRVRGGALPLPMPARSPFMIDDAGWFAWIHFWVPLLAWLFVVSMVAALDIDWHLSHALFAWEGYR